MQGVAPPLTRSEADFDPGAKYHVPANVPYARYFLAHVLEFQFHRALCRTAGQTGPLHTCSIYGNKAAGERFARPLPGGIQRPGATQQQIKRREPRVSGAAVRTRRVHLSPKLPFGWVDFPPSVNRLIGLWWLAKILYPDLFPEDLRALTRDFYSRFYHVTPNDMQIDRVLAGRD